MRALVAAAVVVAVVVAALALWGAAWVFLMLFGAVLLAVGLRGLADPIAARTPLGPSASLAVVVVVALGLCAGAGTLAGSTLSEQVGQLSQELPAKIEEVQAKVRSWPIAQRLGLSPESATSAMQETPSSGGAASSGGASASGEASSSGGEGQGAKAAGGPGGGSSGQGLLGAVVRAVSSAISAVGAFLLVLVCGVYFAIEPRLYVDGVVGLFPQERRPRIRLVLDEVGDTLRRWLLGQILAMTAVGVLTGLGFWALGVPMALALGLIAGILDFVPNFGPLFALVPALLLSDKPALVLLVWASVQAAEGWLITPLVQKRAVHMPPVLLIGSQVVLSVLLGPAGLVTAAPLVAAAMVVVKRLYREDVLGDPVAPPSFAQGAEAEG